MDICEFKGKLVYTGILGQPRLHIRTLFQKQKERTKRERNKNPVLFFTLFVQIPLQSNCQ